MSSNPLSSRLRPDVECAPWVIEAVKKLERQLAEAQTYADKLAESLPEGALPKDLNVLRQANAKLASQLSEAQAELEQLRSVKSLVAAAHATAMKMTAGVFRTVAEQQREACAKWIEGPSECATISDRGNGDYVRKTPLVTESDP